MTNKQKVPPRIRRAKVTGRTEVQIGESVAVEIRRLNMNDIARHLAKQGSYLDWDSEQADAMDELAGHSITYRIAVGPNQGQKAYTLQTLPAISPDDN
ncbi:MAG: IS91 family transposase, partial [Gammaproteobacteria bacterium]